MVKDHIDKLKLYWELIEQTKLEPEFDDFLNEESLNIALSVIKEKIPKKETPDE